MNYLVLANHEVQHCYPLPQVPPKWLLSSTFILVVYLLIPFKSSKIVLCTIIEIHFAVIYLDTPCFLWLVGYAQTKCSNPTC